MPGRKIAEEERKEQILAAVFRVATKHGLERLTIRRVAATAELSSGLVHFHFNTKDDLLVALLDWLLETTTAVQVDEGIRRIASPLERLQALLRKEMNRLTSDRRRIQLFFDFWMRGIHDRRIRARMRAELERYRNAFRPMAEEVLAAEPDRFGDMSAEGLASVAVGLIKGCAVQSVIDPSGFDNEQFLRAARALMAQLEPVPG
jgi:AcrR family transcriptional regulator